MKIMKRGEENTLAENHAQVKSQRDTKIEMNGGRVWGGRATFVLVKHKNRIIGSFFFFQQNEIFLSLLTTWEPTTTAYYIT